MNKKFAAAVFLLATFFSVQQIQAFGFSNIISAVKDRFQKEQKQQEQKPQSLDLDKARIEYEQALNNGRSVIEQRLVVLNDLRGKNKLPPLPSPFGGPVSAPQLSASKQNDDRKKQELADLNRRVNDLQKAIDQDNNDIQAINNSIKNIPNSMLRPMIEKTQRDRISQIEGAKKNKENERNKIKEQIQKLGA